MNRLAAFLLIAWCTAFAQVQPVSVTLAVADCCCEVCDCGSDCAPVGTLPGGPADRMTTVATERSISTERKSPALLAKSVQPSIPIEKPLPVIRATSAPQCDDRVPLFSRHCAFLI